MLFIPESCGTTASPQIALAVPACKTHKVWLPIVEKALPMESILKYLAVKRKGGVSAFEASTAYLYLTVEPLNKIVVPWKEVVLSCKSIILFHHF